MPPPDGTSETNTGWYHIVLTTYGSWLYGDERGFRTRKHREHVDGDYKRPPRPGKYASKAMQSDASLTQEPVELTAKWRAIVGLALVDRLSDLGALVLCCAVGSHHCHILARMSRHAERDWTARAKRHVWHLARQQGWSAKLWARGFRAERIENRQHQLNVYRYILRHAREGAWIWDGMKKD